MEGKGESNKPNVVGPAPPGQSSESQHDNITSPLSLSLSLSFPFPLRSPTTLCAGIGGTCANFDPPFSYFCSSSFSIGCGACFTYSIPGGLKIGDQIKTNLTTWQDGYVLAWRVGHWSNWAFDIESYDPASQTIVFDKGGFQGSRGGGGDEYFLLNFLDELDAPTEYYFDRAHNQLYYYANTTDGSPPPSDAEFVAVVQRTLFNVSGSSQQDAVKNFAVRGVGFRDTAWTMMEPHGVPSGGDWALERMSALFFENTENLQVRGRGEREREKCDGVGKKRLQWELNREEKAFSTQRRHESLPPLLRLTPHISRFHPNNAVDLQHQHDTPRRQRCHAFQVQPSFRGSQLVLRMARRDRHCW